MLNQCSLNGAVVALRANRGSTTHVELAFTDAEQLASTNLLVEMMVIMMELILIMRRVMLRRVTHLFSFLPPAVTVLKENILNCCTSI